MSVLELAGRPYVIFDPSNKSHRSFYNDFVHWGTWGRCPFRFVVSADQGDLITMIQRCLIDYYMNKEFGDVAYEPQELVRQKKPKTVDSQPK